MKIRSLIPLLLVLLGCAAIPSSAQYSGPAVQTPSNGAATVLTTDPKILYAPAPAFHLVPGDLVTVRVFGQGDYNPNARVDLDGNLELPVIGSIHVNGLTISEAETLIAQKLQAGGLYNDPQVLVSVTEGPNAAAMLVGETHAVVPVFGQRGLLEVLNAGGGLPPTASHIVTINRPGVPAPIVVDLGTDPAQSTMANIPVFPGDIISTGRVGVAFAVGAFKNPGVIPLGGNSALTMMQAAATTGGPTFEAKYSDLRLIRTINGQRSVVKLNMNDILYGRAPDPILQANDILFLPSVGWKAATTNGTSGIFFGLIGLVISIASFARF